MSPRSVSLDAFSISETQGTLSLTIASLLSLDNVDHIPSEFCGPDLASMVASGQLWVARRGTCRLILTVRLDEPNELNDTWFASLMRNIGTRMVSLDAWKSLGIRIVASEDSNMPANTLSFAIEHPQPDTLSCPPEIHVATLKSVCCSVHFTSRSPTRKLSARRNGTRKANLTSFESDWIRDFSTQDTEFSRLESAEHSSNDFVASFLESGSLVKLLEAGLTVAVMGRRSIPGYSLAKQTLPLPFTKHAPGVFDLAYLKTLHARAKYLPLISSTLTGLSAAQSPQVREQASFFTANHTGQPVENLQQRSSEETATTRLWRLITSRTKMPTKRTHIGQGDVVGTYQPLGGTKEAAESRRPAVADLDVLGSHAATQSPRRISSRTMSWYTDSWSEGSSTPASLHHGDAPEMDREEHDECWEDSWSDSWSNDTESQSPHAVHRELYLERDPEALGDISPWIPPSRSQQNDIESHEIAQDGSLHWSAHHKPRQEGYQLRSEGHWQCMGAWSTNDDEMSWVAS